MLQPRLPYNQSLSHRDPWRAAEASLKIAQCGRIRTSKSGYRELQALSCSGPRQQQTCPENGTFSAKLVPHVVNFEGPVCTIKPEMIREFFYGDCTGDDAEWAAARLRPQPLAPFATHVQVTDERFGRVPRFYIQCLNDRVRIIGDSVTHDDWT